MDKKYTLNPFNTKIVEKLNTIFTYGKNIVKNRNMKESIMPKYNAAEGKYSVRLYDPETKRLISDAYRQGFVMHSPIFIELNDNNSMHDKILRIVKATNDKNLICNFMYDERKNTWIDVPIEKNKELGAILNIKDRNTLSTCIKNLMKYNIIRKGTLCTVEEGKSKNINVFYVSPLIMYYGGFSIPLYESFRDCIVPYLKESDVRELNTLVEMSYSDDPESILRDHCIGALIPLYEGEFETKKEEEPSNHTDSSWFQRYEIYDNTLENFTSIAFKDIIHQNVVNVKGNIWKIQKNISEWNENLFYVTQPVIDNPKKQSGSSIVKEYLYLPIDIDLKTIAGVVPDNDLEKLEEDKDAVLDILIKNLPEPTSLVRTRNGWQILYRLSKAISTQEEWEKKLRKPLLKAWYPIIDNKAGRAGALFRYPFSIHYKPKDGTMPYNVKLEHLSEKTYNADKLIADLTSSKTLGNLVHLSFKLDEYFQGDEKI